MTQNVVSNRYGGLGNAPRARGSILVAMQARLLIALAAAALACDTSDDGDGDAVASPVLCGELFSCVANNTPLRSPDGCETDEATMAICGADGLINVVDITPVVADVGDATISVQHEDGGTDGTSLLAFTGDCAAPRGTLVHVARDGVWDIHVECRNEGEVTARTSRHRATVTGADRNSGRATVECVSGC